MASIKRNYDERGRIVSYTVRFDIHEAGKRKQKQETFDKYAVANAFKSEVEDQIKKKTYADDKGKMLGVYLLEYLDAFCSNLRGNTKADMKHYFEDFIIPEIGHIPLKDISTTAAEIQAFFTGEHGLSNRVYQKSKYEEKNGLRVLTRPEKKYSPKTIQNIAGYLTTALNKAEEIHLIPKGSNPCSALELPEVVEYEFDPPPAEKIEELLQELRKSELYEGILTEALMGTRRGETAGIWYSDIDLDAAEWHVQRQLYEDKLEKKVMLGPLKSKKSYRTLPLPPLLVDMFLDMKERRDKWREEHKELVILSDFIFTHEDGMPFYPGSFSRAFKKAARKIGLPDMRLHDLRHAYASYLIDQGENPKTVQELLGHGSVHFTLRKYAKAISETKRKANDKVVALYNMNKDS